MILNTVSLEQSKKSKLVCFMHEGANGPEYRECRDPIKLMPVKTYVSRHIATNMYNIPLFLAING
jgi:hypothetical protein